MSGWYLWPYKHGYMARRAVTAPSFHLIPRLSLLHTYSLSEQNILPGFSNPLSNRDCQDYLSFSVPLFYV